MGRIAKRYIDKRSPATFKLNITSMVDMFVMLLVFLLKSFDTSPVQITPSDGLRLPASTSTKEPVEALKVVVSKTGIFVDDRKVVEFTGESIVGEKDLDKADPNFIRTLYTELDKEAQKSKDIAKVNETVEFDGKVIMQADRTIPYSLLKKVMYTSMMAGYADLKMAVLTQE